MHGWAIGERVLTYSVLRVAIIQAEKMHQQRQRERMDQSMESCYGRSFREIDDGSLALHVRDNPGGDGGDGTNGGGTGDGGDGTGMDGDGTGDGGGDGLL